MTKQPAQDYDSPAFQACEITQEMRLAGAAALEEAESSGAFSVEEKAAAVYSAMAPLARGE